MLFFTPSIKLEKSLKQLQSKIQILSMELSSVSEDEKQWLHKWAIISTIRASTRIENAILTDAEIEWVDMVLSYEKNRLTQHATLLCVSTTLKR